MRKGKIIHEWKEPKEVKRFISGLMIKMGRDFVPRVLVAVAALLLLLFWFLNRTLPDEVLPALNRGLIGVFVAAIGFCSLYFAYPVLGRRFGTKYEITDKKITQTDIGGGKVMLWKDVKGYTPSEDTEFPKVVSIIVHPKHRKMVLWIPKGELAEQVMTTFSERCPLIRESEAPESRRAPLSDFEILELLLTTVAYSIVVGYLVSVYLSRPTLIIVLVITLLVGPGTIGCLLLYGKKTFRDKNFRGLAYGFNFCGFILLMLTWVLFALYPWSQVIKELE